MAAMKTEDLIPIVIQMMKEFSVRSFDAKVITDDFGTEMVAISPHLNDLSNCDDVRMFQAISVAANARVAYRERTNQILVLPLEQTRPGTVPWRFVKFMDELDKRFPKGAGHRMYCMEPPELHLLREIDEYIANSTREAN